MTHAINLNSHALPSLTGGFFARLFKAAADRRRYFTTYDELSALSDRELADIGLSRPNVADVARDSVWGN